MKTLPTKFKKHGFDYTQKKRVGDIAIYEQSKDGAVIGFEVLKIKRHDGRVIAGKSIEPSEFGPSSEQWGTNGFTLTTYGRAVEKMDELLRAGQ